MEEGGQYHHQPIQAYPLRQVCDVDLLVLPRRRLLLHVHSHAVGQLCFAGLPAAAHPLLQQCGPATYVQQALSPLSRAVRHPR